MRTKNLEQGAKKKKLNPNISRPIPIHPEFPIANYNM